MRTHLGVYLLQQLLNETDRGIERQVRDNAVYAVFCGKLFVHNWTVPDHTKIEEFSSRLSPETQCGLSNEITRLAARKGFAKPEHVDIDSTIQTPDMQCPATINLLLKTAIVGRRIQKILKRKIPDVVKDHIPDIDMKFIKGFARIIAEPFILESLPKRDKNLITHFIRKAPAILTELFERCYENASRKTKTFSYNRDEVACFNKGKHHKPLEFGRQFQIGRVGGNFVLHS